MSNLKVLVVGASVAGPTTAYWLAKAGAHVTVIERFPHLRTSGQNIDIRTVGVTVMRKMAGMEAAVRAKLVPLDGFSMVDTHGKIFATMKATGNPEQQSLVSEYEIYRGDLGKVLHDLSVEDDNNQRVKYVFGEQIAAMHQSEDLNGPVTVTFANGKLPTTDYDLVVACDGATSRTRALGLDCGVRDHIESMSCWAAYFDIPHDLLKGSNMGLAHAAVGGRMFCLGPNPSGGCKGTLISMHPKSDPNATLPFREASKKGTDGLKEYIRDRFSGAGWLIDDILAGMMKSDNFYASEVVQVKLPTLSRGRFVLVGDAGYAPGFTGTGTSMAIAGGYLLAGEINNHKGDLAAGLKAYEERMKPIIKDLQSVPPGMPHMLAPQTAWRISLRNLLFTVVCWGASMGAWFAWTGKIFGSAVAKDKYGIPDYDWEYQPKDKA